MITLLLNLAFLITPAWQRHASPVTDDLHSVFFVDDSTGWVLAHRSGAVLHTADGGATWKMQARLGEGFLESIQFLDGRTGWICGDKGRLYRTVDGGVTWEDRNLGRPDVSLYGLRFLDPRRGFLVGVDMAGRRGVIFETADGGATWSRREDAPTNGGFTDAVAFPSPLVGFLGGTGAIAATRDGGRTWTSRALEGGVVRDLFFLDERTGWAVGHDGLALRTRDGGETWERLASFTRNRLRSVRFQDARRGWAAGDATKEPGVLFATEDGGATWRRVEVDAPDLHRFAASPGRLWVVGKGGTILSLP